MNEHKRAYLILLVLLALALGTPAMAKMDMQGKDGEGDSIPPCDCDQEADPNCCDDQERPGGDRKLPTGVVDDCDDDAGGWGPLVPPPLEHLMACGTGGIGSEYDWEPIPDGISIGYTNGGELECGGISESDELLGMITLRHTVPGKVARIEKFVEDPVGPTPENPFFTAVYIQVNAESFTIGTSWIMTVEQLNDAIENALAVKFNVTSHDGPEPYWIVGTHKIGGDYPYLVSVRADDEGLVTMDVELRNFDPFGDYDTGCGEY